MAVGVSAETHKIALFFHWLFKVSTLFCHFVYPLLQTGGESIPVKTRPYWSALQAQTVGVLYYVFCGWFPTGFIYNFIVCTVLIALDFWTVKNVSGRKLVGLRWWNEVSEQGLSAWRFEQAPEGSRVIHPGEKRLFWIGLFANLIAWAALAFFALVRLHFDYLIIPIIGCIMGSSNLVGYFKCSREAGEQLKAVTTDLMSRAATRAVTSAVTRSTV